MPSPTKPTGIDLVSFAKQVEMVMRGDERLSDALDCARPHDKDNIRAMRSEKHGAIEVTFRFDERTFIYGRSVP